MKYYIGADVGGTNLAAGVVDENYRIISKEVLPAGNDRAASEVIDDIANVIQMAINEAGLTTDDFETCGIGMPSYVNPRTRLLVHANCFGWKNFPIYEYLEKKLPFKIEIGNDANCAAFGEYLNGAAKNTRNIVMLTLGTGLGGAVIIDGQIYSGADSMGTELGHVKLVYGGKTCTCGQKGCAEAYCSATALIGQAKTAMDADPFSLLWKLCSKESLNGEMIFKALKERDATAQRVFDQYIDYLSCAISSYITIFRPEKIILGGGISNAGELLLSPLRKKLIDNTFGAKEIGIPDVVLASLGNDAGIIGAAFI